MHPGINLCTFRPRLLRLAVLFDLFDLLLKPHFHASAVPGRRAALRLPLPIAGQRGQPKPLLLAELTLAQPAGFVFGHQLPGFRATPAAPNFYYRCLLVHPSTASRTAAREQMGCSNAYD